MIAMLYLGFGWRVTFFIVGSLGILWVIPWLIVNKVGPAKHPWIKKEEQDYILSDQIKPEEGKDDKGLPLLKILSYKESRAVLVSRFFLEPIWWLFVGWMPLHLADQYGFDVKQIGLFAWVPYVGAALGSISGGWFAGWKMAGGASVDSARKSTIAIGGVIMFLGLVTTILFADTPLKFVLFVAAVLLFISLKN
jgi:ACS family hexuronate transporter-like MFS transporter